MTGAAVDEDMTNFSSVKQSLVPMFQILMSNNWDDLLYTVGSQCGTGSKIFIVLSFIVLVFVTGNIFTSIVLQSFDVHEHGPSELRDSGLAFDSPSAPRHGVLYISMPDGVCYKLQRRHNQQGFELHMDLLDATKAELLQDCITGDNMFRTVLTQSEHEIVAGTAKFKPQYMLLLVMCAALLCGCVMFVTLHSCTCHLNSQTC